jgi:threonine dehydratase
MNFMKIPTFNDIKIAHSRIKNSINYTPILSSSYINSITNSKIYFKCENFQKIGAFKYRGATNSVLSLTDEEAVTGVATHSSGNHAQALALAALKRNIKAYIVMPNNAPNVKINAVKDYRAEIIFCEPTLAERESTLNRIVKETNAKFIHPFKHFEVIAGQGTVALEIFEEIDNIDLIVAPVGGGGLISGTTIATLHLSPKTKIIAAEPEGADDAFRSFYGDKLVPSLTPDTICDGLLTSLGEINFQIIKKSVSEIFIANDFEIIEAMKLVWERMKIIIEPSSAVSLAIILKNKDYFKNQKIAIILSGGNIDLNKLPW